MPAASVLDFGTTLVGDHGLYAVFALMLVDAVLPAASEAVLVFGGALASGAFGSGIVVFGSRLDPGLRAYLGIAVAGTLGYVLGSLVGWGIGRYGGRPFVERHGRLLHMSESNIERADRWFARYDDAFVLFGRVIPIVRSFVAIPAGLARMPVGRYTLLTIPGSAAWCFGLAGAGWALGAHWKDFTHAFRYADYVVVAAVLAGVAYLVWRRRSSGRDHGHLPLWPRDEQAGEGSREAAYPDGTRPTEDARMRSPAAGQGDKGVRGRDH